MSDDLIYIDVDYVNQTDTDSELVFKSNRNEPYLQTPEDYYMSIVRFEISNTSLLPVFIPQIQPNQPDINKTVYELMIKDNSNTHSSGNIPISFTSEYPWESQPSSVGPVQDNNPYYFYYSYQHFAEDLNKALHDAMDILRTSSGVSTLEDPYFVFDNQTKRFTLYAHKEQFDQNSSSPFYEIYINEDLKSILASFQYYNYKMANDFNQNMPYQFVLTSKYTHNNLVNLNNGFSSSPLIYITATSQDLDISVMNPISSILFTTDNIPVVPTGTATINDILYNNQSNNTTSIISDFQVPITETNSYRCSVNYSPSVYRYFSMHSSNPLNKIVIRCLWKDKYGRIYDLMVPKKSYANMKLLFKKKDSIA